MERCRHVTLILRKMDQSVLPASWRALDNSPSGEKIHPVRFSRSLMRGGCPSSTPPAEQTPSVEGPCPLAEVQVVAIHPQPHAAKQEIAPPSLWGLGPNRALSEGAFFLSSSKASHLQTSQGLEPSLTNPLLALQPRLASRSSSQKWRKAAHALKPQESGPSNVFTPMLFSKSRSPRPQLSHMAPVISSVDGTSRHKENSHPQKFMDLRFRLRNFHPGYSHVYLAAIVRIISSMVCL